MILGFGQTENEFEQQEFNFINDFLKEKSEGHDDFWFTDEIASELKMLITERANQYKADDEKYKTAESYPQRYSTYYFTVLHDIGTLCVAFKFSHINRRHALSPDGWGMLQTKNCFCADVWDYRN